MTIRISKGKVFIRQVGPVSSTTKTSIPECLPHVCPHVKCLDACSHLYLTIGQYSFRTHVKDK